MPILNYLPLNFEKKRILLRLRYKPNITQISSEFEKLFEKILREAISLIEPAGIYEVFDIKENDGEKIILSNSTIFYSKKLSEVLKPCKRIILMAATLGSKISEEIYNRQNIAEAAILDAAGSELAEEAIESIEKIARLNIPAKEVTMRFSPGYADWNLYIQPEILRILAAQRIGMTSNESHILIPEKSITAVCGIINS